MGVLFNHLLLLISIRSISGFAAFHSQPYSITRRIQSRPSKTCVASSSPRAQTQPKTNHTLDSWSRAAQDLSSNATLLFSDSNAFFVKQPNETKESQQQLSLWAARAILLFVSAIWGTNFACVKYLNELCFHPPCNHPPSEFAFARFGVAAMVSIPLLLQQRRDVILAGFECGLWIALGYVAQSMALATISAGECAFICSLTVVFVPIVSLILYGKPLKVKDMVAGATAIAGVAILEGMWDVQSLFGVAPMAQESVMATTASAVTSTSMDTTATGPIAMLAQNLGVSTGDLMALGQPVGFGFAFTRIEHYQEQFKDVENRVLTIAAAQCLMVGILSLIWVLYDYHGVIPDFGYLSRNTYGRNCASESFCN